MDYISLLLYLYHTRLCISGDATNSMHLQNLQGLAALANATSNPGTPTLPTSPPTVHVTH